MQTDHFREATESLPAYLSETPDIINVKVDGWSKLGELAVSSPVLYLIQGRVVGWNDTGRVEVGGEVAERAQGGTLREGDV